MFVCERRTEREAEDERDKERQRERVKIFDSSLISHKANAALVTSQTHLFLGRLPSFLLIADEAFGCNHILSPIKTS